tara:strand:- start:96 stop:761 length:666 start_codon:yes stop_codon:yes gene_type:complete
MTKIEIIKLLKVFLLLFLFSFETSAISYKNKFPPITILGGLNSSDVFNNNNITGEVLSIYRPTIGMETSLGSFKIKEPYGKIKLKISISLGGFDNRLVNENIEYEVVKKYRLNYFKFSLLYPILNYQSKIYILSGIYLGLPISSNYMLYKNSFVSNQDSKKIDSSWLKTDFGFSHVLKYNINKKISAEAFIYRGIKNAFYNKKEYYKTINIMIGVRFSYLI